jgi:opacity protein-like surface antigen
MKPVVMATVLLGLFAAAAPADAQNAQTGRLVHADVSGTLGWVHAKKDSGEGYNDWSPTLFGGIDVGFYWTDHVKTEVEAGANREFGVYIPETFEVDGQSFHAASNYRFAARRLGLVGKYQFGHNQWFHPFLGGGVEIVVERVSERDEAVYAYDQVTRAFRLVRPAFEHPDRTETRALGLANAGFKAYLHPRAFFLTDVRTGFRSNIEEVLLRFGLGVDF